MTHSEREAMAITKEEVERLGAIEDETRAAARDAGIAASEAREKFAEQKIRGRGISLEETIVIAPKWGFSFSRERVRCIVVGATGAGKALCHEVTSSGKPHGGRNPFSCDVDKLEIES